MADIGVSTPTVFDISAVDAESNVEVPSFTMPFSSLASPEARKAYLEAIWAVRLPMMPGADFATIMAEIHTKLVAPWIDKQNARYAVEMTTEILGGVFTEIFTPKNGIAAKNTNRVLINLHGGGFVGGARTISKIESIPIAGLGRIKVISIDYRMFPEHLFPAASEDVACVYRELLKDYSPENIGIYGCSAGGILTGQSVAWFDKEQLPMPGAVGIFSAAISPLAEGDSVVLSPLLMGFDAPMAASLELPYFSGTAATDPLIWPANSPELLAKFPPSLLLTGARSWDCSTMVFGHSQLIKAGVDARLHLWDGLWHGFFMDADIPESREAYQVIVSFFDQMLGGK